MSSYLKHDFFLFLFYDTVSSRTIPLFQDHHMSFTLGYHCNSAGFEYRSTVKDRFIPKTL